MLVVAGFSRFLRSGSDRKDWFYSQTCQTSTRTPFQNAMRFLISAAAGFGSG
jgi:hypothetical protein